jgi:transmembrane sensor
MKHSMEQIEESAAAWVFRRVAGLTAEVEAAFACWRTADPQHEVALARHEGAWSLLDRPRDAGQADFVLEKLAERASRRRRRIGFVSTVCVLLIAGPMAWYARHPFPAPPGGQALILLPIPQTLDDGSIVEMKSETEITVDFSGTFRRVALKRGEAHFQVARQSRPFVVTANNVEFRAVGTAFSVHLADAQVELLVTEGSVAVEQEEINARAEAETQRSGDTEMEDRKPRSEVSSRKSDFRPPAFGLIVAAGNRIVIASASEAGARILAPSFVPVEEIAERLAWRAPRLEFSDTSLSEAVALMNQHNRMKLVIEDAELGKLLVSGLFRADRVEAFVRLLETNFNVKAEQVGQLTHLHRAD